MSESLNGIDTTNYFVTSGHFHRGGSLTNLGDHLKGRPESYQMALMPQSELMVLKDLADGTITDIDNPDLRRKLISQGFISENCTSVLINASRIAERIAELEG